MKIRMQRANQQPSSKPRPRLSPEINLELQYLDPLLHVEWRSRINSVFKKLNGEERKYAYLRHLVPKGIRIDTESKRLTFSGRPSLANIRIEIKSSRLLQITNKLEQTIGKLQRENDATAYIDIMESSICMIDDFNPDGNLKQQKEKLRLRQAYLDDLVHITRNTELSVPQNMRGLTSIIVQSFIIEVFLHQQMQGYRFRTQAIESLLKHPHPFIQKTVYQEALIRQCEVIHTERYLYLIGPTQQSIQNAFSARRFMNEESVMNGSAVFFNAMVVPLRSLDKPKITEHLSWSLSRIVTLERQVSADTKELIEQCLAVHRNSLLPILTDDIIADGSNLARAIDQKLVNYEQILTNNILAKLPNAVIDTAKTHDDHDYLFFHIRNLLILLASDIRDFCSHFAVSYSNTAKELELRILSYLCLMEKRKDSIFSLGLKQNPGLLNDAKKPALEFKATITEIEPATRAIEKKIQSIQQQILKPRNNLQIWLDQRLDRQTKRRAALNGQRIKLNLKKKQCLVALIRICKHDPSHTAYLELENIVEVDEKVRHYALPAGTGGIGQLPKLVRLWENEADFNFTEIMTALGFTPKHQ